jgi:hypothetical protein
VIIGRGHLEQVLQVYLQHYNQHRPHRALGLEAPGSPAGLTIVSEAAPGAVHRATCSAVWCTSTGELHERISAPHRLIGQLVDELRLAKARPGMPVTLRRRIPRRLRRLGELRDGRVGINE